MSNEIIKVPDIGSSDEVEVIEISVKAGDRIEEETTLIVLESDKASMDIPSPMAGVVTKVLVSEGDKVKEGSPILEVEVEGADSAPATEPEAAAEPEPVIAMAESESEPTPR